MIQDPDMQYVEGSIEALGMLLGVIARRLELKLDDDLLDLQNTLVADEEVEAERVSGYIHVLALFIEQYRK